jgi:hypothetical protein
MLLRDQHGGAAYAWFPPGTPTDPEHVLPARLYAEVCRLAGLAPSSPWVAFRDSSAALAAAVAATLVARHHPPGQSA